MNTKYLDIFIRIFLYIKRCNPSILYSRFLVSLVVPKGRNSGNSRNGPNGKEVMSESLEDLVLSISRDRNYSFELKLIPKHQRTSEQIVQSIIGLYWCGTSTGDIEEQIREAYGVDVSESIVSTVTNHILDHILLYRKRVYIIPYESKSIRKFRFLPTLFNVFGLSLYRFYRRKANLVHYSQS